MPHPFLSDAWFTEVDALVAAAGDLQIPEAMKAVEINLTVTSPAGDIPLNLEQGLFKRGHKAGASTTLTLDFDLARKIFVEGDAAAGMQAFMAGQIKVDGDLSKVMAMQMSPPSEPQKALTKKIAAITA
jgi:hypothetical protein